MDKDGILLITQKPTIIDEASIYDQRENKFNAGWTQQFKRVRTITPIYNQVFDDDTTIKTSKPFYCEPYSKFSLLVDLGVTGTPTDILIELKFSNDNAKFYKLMNGPFGDLRYEDSAGNLLEEIQGTCNGSWCHIKVTATGTTAVHKFTLTNKIVFVT